MAQTSYTGDGQLLQLIQGASACSAMSVLVGASGMEWNVAKYWRALFSSALLRGHHQPFS